MDGGRGADSMSGGDGNDHMAGRDGADRMDGGAGADCMKGGNDNDTMTGGTGADIMLGEAGNDSMDGGADNDSLDGGSGNDVIRGGDGNDWIAGSAGSDTLYGGAGADNFVFRQDEDAVGTINYIRDWDAGDTITLCGQSSFFYFVTKIDFGSFDNDGVANDVAVALSDGSFIYISNAAADFTPGHTPPMEFVGNNVDDFVHRDTNDPGCRITCPDPDSPVVLRPIEFCYDPDMVMV
jgi:Ca2+-binding RTX toxin-like protein